jgi:hypothetical protein
MNLKVKIRKILREHYGDFNSFLEVEYENKLIENLLLGNLSVKEAWATYNQVVLELKFALRDDIKVQELQYSLTDNSDPKVECLRVLSCVMNPTPELIRLHEKIKNYV